MSQVRVLHRLRWKCNCSCVLSRLRNKFSKFYKISLVLIKIMLNILCLCFFCWHSVYLWDKLANVETVSATVSVNLWLLQSQMNYIWSKHESSRPSHLIFVATLPREICVFRYNLQQSGPLCIVLRPSVCLSHAERKLENVEPYNVQFKVW